MLNRPSLLELTGLRNRRRACVSVLEGLRRKRTTSGIGFLQAVTPTLRGWCDKWFRCWCRRAVEGCDWRRRSPDGHRRRASPSLLYVSACADTNDMLGLAILSLWLWRPRFRWQMIRWVDDAAIVANDGFNVLRLFVLRRARSTGTRRRTGARVEHVVGVGPKRDSSHFRSIVHGRRGTDRLTWHGTLCVWTDRARTMNLRL